MSIKFAQFQEKKKQERFFERDEREKERQPASKGDPH